MNLEHLKNLAKESFARAVAYIAKSRRRTLIALGASYLFLFLLFSYLLFPYGQLKDFALQEFHYPRLPNGERGRSAYILEVDSLRPHWFTGVKLKNVHFRKRTTISDQEASGFSADAVTIHPSILSLLVGKKSASFDVELGDGEIDGSYSGREEGFSLDADIDDVDLKELALIESLIGLPSTGLINGSIELNVAKEAAENNGEIELSIEGLSIGDDKAALKIKDVPPGMKLAKIDAGDLEAHVSIENGIGKIDQFQSSGKDLELQGSGEIRPRFPFNQSAVNALVKFKFNDAYKKKNDTNIGLFMILDNLPQMKRAKTSDGWLQYRLRGNFTRLRPLPDGKARNPS
ncbi:MAG: type II secretion system protein GspN [Myxococcales bacterium]|nr:MAG: type II secretion system protein GspN [Myxococcales bacterium]